MQYLVLTLVALALICGVRVWAYLRTFKNGGSEDVFTGDRERGEKEKD